MNRMMSTAFRILVLVFIVSSALYAQDDLTKGKELLQAGNTAKAIEYFKDHVKDNEKDPQGYVWLAKAYLGMDSVQKAEAELIKGRALASASGDIYRMLGDVYMTKKVWVAAGEQYTKATEFDSMNIPLYLQLADAYTKARKYAEVGKAYKRILEIDSTNFTAIRGLGTLYYRAKQYANALPLLRKVYAVQPDSIEVQYGYAKTLFETKNCEEMIPIAEALYKRDPSLTEIQTWLGDCYKATKAFDRVIGLYGGKPLDALKLDELITLANAYRSVDTVPTRAVTVYEAIMMRDSSRCDVLYEMGTTYMKLKNYAKAVSTFERRIACDTVSGYRYASHLNAGMSQMQLKDFKAAEAHILSAIDIRPDNVQAHLTLAQNYVQLGNVAKQRGAYQDVIRLASMDTTGSGRYDRALEEAYRMEGVQELLEKNYPKAIDYLKKSIAINPKHCNTVLLTAQAYHNSNNVDEAAKYYCRVLSTCPNGDDAAIAKKGLEILGKTCDSK